MSQRVNFVEFAGIVALTSDIEDEDVIEAALDNGLTGETDYIKYWFEFGEGESDTDEFISENEIQQMIDEGKASGNDVWDIVAEFRKRGYDEELIEVQTGTVYVDETDDYEDDDYYKSYSPSNPWDAPGMSVSDFLGGVNYSL